MASAGIKDLKNRLTYYLRRTKQGEEIVVTERGRPIAVIQPIQSIEHTVSQRSTTCQAGSSGIPAPSEAQAIRQGTTGKGSRTASFQDHRGVGASQHPRGAERPGGNGQDRLCRQFDHHWGALVRIELLDEVQVLARDLISRHPLRAYDAVHLASALSLRTVLGEAVTLCCGRRMAAPGRGRQEPYPASSSPRPGTRVPRRR